MYLTSIVLGMSKIIDSVKIFIVRLELQLKVVVITFHFVRVKIIC